jgi:hypothetical protein
LDLLSLQVELNGKAPEVSGAFFFSLYFNFIRLIKLVCQCYLVCFYEVEWVRGLTRILLAFE